MDEQAKKAARQARIEMTRKFNSLIVNMTKTQTLIYDLSRAIELDERHQKEDREQAIAFIDQQIEIIKRAKESFLQSDNKADTKQKKDALGFSYCEVMHTLHGWRGIPLLLDYDPLFDIMILPKSLRSCFRHLYSM